MVHCAWIENKAAGAPSRPKTTGEDERDIEDGIPNVLLETETDKEQLETQYRILFE